MHCSLEASASRKCRCPDQRAWHSKGCEFQACDPVPLLISCEEQELWNTEHLLVGSVHSDGSPPTTVRGRLATGKVNANIGCPHVVKCLAVRPIIVLLLTGRANRAARALCRILAFKVILYMFRSHKPAFWLKSCIAYSLTCASPIKFLGGHQFRGLPAIAAHNQDQESPKAVYSKVTHRSVLCPGGSEQIRNLIGTVIETKAE